jgi:Fe-S-cluster-containing dehydrogenase component
MTRYAMVIDLKKCIGCHSCTVACKVENSTRPGIFWNRVEDRELGKYPSVRRLFLPKPCMHCQNPPCVDVCPTGASFKREDGIVLVDSDKCIGCKACMLACPYQSRFYNEKESVYFPGHITPNEQIGYLNHKVGTVGKCNFCVQRVAKGLEPACILSCQAKARYFGDLDDTDSQVRKLVFGKQGFQLSGELGTDPSVFYLPL